MCTSPHKPSKLVVRWMPGNLEDKVAGLDINTWECLCIAQKAKEQYGYVYKSP